MQLKANELHNKDMADMQKAHHSTWFPCFFFLMSTLQKHRYDSRLCRCIMNLVISLCGARHLREAVFEEQESFLHNEVIKSCAHIKIISTTQSLVKKPKTYFFLLSALLRWFHKAITLRIHYTAQQESGLKKIKNTTITPSPALDFRCFFLLTGSH